MKKGELWIIEIPGIDGHEQSGRRPALLFADTKTHIAIVIPCTSNLHALRFPYTLQITPSKNNGLATPSVALLLQIRAIDKKRLQKKIGTLEKKSLDQIDNLLRKLFHL